MKAKSSIRETSFAPGTSRNRKSGVTFRLGMARDKTELLAMGARIKELRESHGFKQQWIADQIGVALRTYQFWQAGQSPPEQEHLEKLASLFGVTPKYILRGETPELMSDDHLDRIEAKLDEVLNLLRAPAPELPADVAAAVEDVVALADESPAESESPQKSASPRRQRSRGARRHRPA